MSPPEPPFDAAPSAVLGAGAWGSALAILLARNGHAVRLWTRDADHAAQMARDGENRRYLPDIPFPPGLTVAAQIADAVAGARTLWLVIPSSGFRETLRRIDRPLNDDVRIVWAAKGLEAGTPKLLHCVVADEVGEAIPTAVVSGPSFAREAAMGLPTAIAVASASAPLADELARALGNDRLRVYTSRDVIGVEVGGAVKNVLAIAIGICDGLALGANARAALITRGLAEMMRLADALGGRHETLIGLSGLGDLILTCTDDQSRNRRLGLAIGAGQKPKSALQAIHCVVEGFETTRAIHELAEELGVDMPITDQIFRILHEGSTPRQALDALFQRAQKTESIESI